jgi:hypothetical protein
MTLDVADSAATEAEAPEDIRSLLTNALERHESVSDTGDKADPAPAVESRHRAPDGRFAKTEEAAPAEGTEQPAATEATTAPEAKAAPAEPAATEPPANWSAADKTAFKGMPPEAQTFLLNRHKAMEADYTKKTQAIAGFRNDYEPVASLLAPHAEDMRRAGYTPATLIQSWMGVERDLQQGRGVHVVKSLVDGYKLDRAQIAQALGLNAPASAIGTEPPAPAQPASAIPPELQQKLSQYDQFIAQQQRERAEQAARAQRETETRVMSTVEQFKGATDASGAPLHPHYDELEDDMVALLMAARARGQADPPLDKLYETAVWANPSTRQKLQESTSAAQEAQRKASEAEAAKQARAKAEQARRAGSSVTGAPNLGQSGRAAPGSLRDTIRAAMETSV